MAGTFEIVFSGLCLLLLNGDGEGYSGVEANLIRTSVEEDRYTNCKEDGESIQLHEHKPYLVIPKTSDWNVSCHGDTPCDFPQGTDCDEGLVEWYCPLEGKELCLKVEPSLGFEVVQGRDGMENDPEDEDKPAFDWISHLERIDGKKISRLKRETGAPVITGGQQNPLIASRITSSVGTLSTKNLGVPYDATSEWIWSVKPDDQPGWPWQEDHPKALSEDMSLHLGTPQWVELKECGGGTESYKWRFEQQEQQGSSDLTIRVQNLALEPCDASCESDHPCTICNDGPKNRLRHFLWYYQLVEWEGGKCPTYHSAPVCPGAACRKVWADYLPPNYDGSRGDPNHFCPPTTYP